MDLYDTMDAMMEKTQEEARSCGRAKGESDAATDFELTSKSGAQKAKVTIVLLKIAPPRSSYGHF